MNSDQLFAAQIKEGNDMAKMSVYRSSFGSIFGSVLKLIGNAQDAEDVVQEAFIAAFEKISKYDGKGSLEGWIRRIAINRSLDFLRKKQLVSLDEIEINEAPEDECEGLFWENMDVSAIVQGMAKLPSGYGTILKLHLIEGLKHEEIGASLGLKAGTVRSQYIRGKAKLKMLLEEEYGR